MILRASYTGSYSIIPHMQQLAIVYYVSVPKQVVILSIMADSNPPPLLLISTKALSCTVRYNTIFTNLVVAAES